MNKALITLAALVLPAAADAHHGVAGVGAAALRGPGATIEAATSTVLPQGRWLLYLKLDEARFKTFDPAQPEADVSRFWIAGLGYGLTPWLSAYAFLPYHDKRDEPGGFGTRGYADASLFAQIGFRYDRGWSLLPAAESLDDLEDWHFTVFAGTTLSTGNPDLKDAEGRVDPGKATGFGKPAWTLGLTATKMLNERLTANLELSRLQFREHGYDDPAGLRFKFGTESRANASLAYRLHIDEARRLRTDLVLETQYLQLGRDRENGSYAQATGGRIVYAVPGVRVYLGAASVALGFKKPVWTRLNEADLQQGAEGRERYRLLLSASWLL